MKNLVFNLRTAKAQAEGCAKVTKSSRMAKLLTTLTLLLTLCVGQAWGAELKEGQYIYINYNTSTWGTASAKFKFNWYWNVGDYCCVDNEAGRVSGENYAYAQTQNAYTRAVQILRYNSTYSSQWNYTGTVAVSSNTKNCITLTDAISDNYTFSWTTYAPPMSTVTLSDNGTEILAGTGISSDPYLIATGATINVRASGTKAVPDPDATIYYNIKDNTTSKQNSTTATYSFTASGTANTVYQMKVDGYTKVSSTSSTTKTSSTIYYKTVSVKDISVYIYVGGRTSGEYNSVEMNGCTPYVGTKALDAVKINNQSAGAPKFTLSGNWLVYTFEDVTKVSNITCARSGGNIFTGEITDNVYYMYDGTELDGQCIHRTTPTWNVAPANGAAGGSMTASINNVPAGATVTWSSTATSYATVNSSGVISYVATGSATIKAHIQKAASDDYCALDYTLSQAITVTSGATVTATRTSPEYVPTGVAGQVSMHITFTGTSSGWKYRVKHNWDIGYETDWLDASGSSADWTMTGGVGTGTYAYVVELYSSQGGTLVTTSSPVSVTGEITQTVNIAAGAHGSVSPSGEIRANNNHVHPTITATPNEHYNFVNWTSNYPSSAWVASATSATTTVTATAPGYTITANFAGDQYTIIYKDQGGSAFSGTQTSAPTTHTYGTATTLKIPTKTGYTFNGWFTVQDCSSGQVGTASAASLSATGYTSNITLYAKWTANTYDITYVDANNVATITANPATGSTDATINFTVTLKPGFKSLSVTAVDAGSNTVTVTNPSSNNYRFTMPASAVTVTVTATALPIVYVLKTKHASSSLGDGATGFPSDGKIWAWKASGSNNFYTSPGDFPGPTASSKAATYTDDIIGDEWYRFIPDNTSYFDGSTAYHVILTSTNRILDTQSAFIENGSSHTAATHTGTIWIVPHGTDANTAYLYTSYPDEIATPYDVTYNAGDHGSINVFGTTITSGNSQTISTTKNRTLTATPASGYEFNRWVTSGSVTVADATSATTTVSATGAGGTVTATYFEAVNSGWYIKGDPAGSDWISPTSLPLNRVLPGETNVYYRPVTLPANDQYFRFWCSNGGNHQYGASSKNLAVSKDTKYNLTYDGDNAFKYSAGGTVWFVVDASGDTKKCWLQDPVEFYSVNFGYGDGCDEFTAKDGEDKDLVSGNTYVSGTELTFTQTKKDGYTFVGWNTAADGSGSSLGTGSSYTVASLSADVNVYAIYTENKTAITITTDGHGTITTPDPNESPYSLGVATTQAINATASDGYHWNTWTVSGTAALVSSASTQSNTVKGNGTDGGTGTVTATFTPNTYRVQFHRNGGAGVVVYQDFTYDVAQNLTANSYTRTGYNFAGWALTTDGAVTYANGENVSNLTSENGATFHLYAKWTPKQSALTFDYQTSAEGYGTSGSIAAVSATYGAAMPALTGNMPTAAQGYAFMGFYSETGGNGTLYYNPDKTSAHNWDVNTESTTTLYAYYKKAEITDVVLNAGIFNPVEAGDPETYVTADPTLDPTPAPTIKLCWELRYSNDNPVTGHNPISVSGNQVKFLLNGLAAGGYKIHVELRTGSECGAGTLLSSYDKSFSIASDHIVTIQYKSGDFTLKASTNVGGKPLEWSEEITADTIDGYAFSSWTAGDGVTIKDSEGEDKTTSTEATIKIKANYDGTLTANYTKKRMIYFNNTLGWESVYVYFYRNNKYWGYGSDAGKGTGSSTEWTKDATYPFIKSGAMTQIDGTDIWFYDCEANSVDANVENIVFTEYHQENYTYFSYKYGTTTKNNVICRGDYKTSLPMFVPLTGVDPVEMNNKQANYYNEGYWMNYPENTGYTLKIYNSKTYGTLDELQSIPFEFTADKTLPMSLTVELNANKEYGFEIHRADGTTYGNDTKVMKINDSGDNADAWAITSGKRTGVKTSVAGDYIFTLNFGNNGGYNYLVGVHYPVAKGDYRILYQDLTTWSQSSAHTSSWSHPSRAIHKEDGAEDIVSFYVSKATGANATMKFQYASAVSVEGVVTWTDVSSGSIDLSGISASGVYNFYLTQSAGAISVDKIEAYTGKFYIRTDCAGSTKWENYRASDHEMPYTEFSMSDANSFGEKYSHYYTHWCPGGTNIKFVVANEYSSCISDTLESDLHDWGNLNDGGWLKHQAGKSETQDIYSANVRFMYNQETNKISRAYVASSTEASRLFLVLRGNEVIKDENGTAVSDQGVTNGAILSDKENWIYERILQIKPDSRFKLFACYAEASPTQSGAQYFRGAYDSNNFTTDANSVILISGTGGYQKARILYDFKTNRLVCAWLPSDEPIDEPLDIDADVMVIRDHQEAAECITFSGSGSKLTDVKTVYGVMKFNRWTLNNRYRGIGGVEDNDKDHCDTPKDISTYHGVLPAGDQKSVYERSLYFISFPFDVKVSEIFGFGTYGKHWVLEYYDGLNRAKNGYWIDSPANWKYVTPSMAKTYELKAYEGYILCLSLGRMAYDNTEVWPNNISNVELYFPSKVPMGNIQTTNVTIPGLSDEYQCTINRGTPDGDRRIKDSYWRCLGVPSYDMYAGTLTSDGSTVINWQTDYSTFPFLYAWNMNDNTLTPQSTNRFSFKPMHAYLTQIGTPIYWTNVSATPASVMARQTEEPTEYNWCLTLNAGEQMIDQTYIRMSTDEHITNEFDFGQDLAKELNAGRSDIYSFIGYERAAANSMQMNTETTTIVPLGLNIEATGEYTFSIPDGTNGIGITLIDEETGIRTSLSALDYTVELAAGDYTERFWIEISPVKGAETGIDPGVDARENGVRKVMIDGLLYIVRDGKMYDATGKRVE